MRCSGDGAREAIWLATAVIIPLVVNPWSCNPVETPKTALLQAAACAMGLATLLHVLRRPGRRSQHLPHRPAWTLVGPVLAFGLALILATVFSVDPRLSLWGSFGRRQGLVTLLAYLTVFLVTSAGLRTRPPVERLLRAIVWGSVPVTVYGLCQAAGLDPVAWQTDGTSPVLSTLGRANFLGSYLVLVWPLTLAILLSPPVGSALRRWPYALLLAGQAACLAATQARAAWVGWVAANLAFGLLYAWCTGRRCLVCLVLSLIVVGGGLLGWLAWSDAAASQLATLPGLERLHDLLHPDAGSSAARLTIWRATWSLIVDRPWLGYGPDTMHVAFAAAFPPELVYYQGRQVNVDRAHNLWLDLAVAGGVAGVVTFFVVLASLGWTAWRGVQRSGGRELPLVWIGLVAAVVGHLADLQFGFETTATATLFWMCLGLAVVLTSAPRDAGFTDQPGRSLPHSQSPRLLETGTEGAHLATPSASQSGPENEVRPAPPRPNVAGGAAGVGAGRVGEKSSFLPYLPPLLAALALIGLVCARPFLADVACWQAQYSRRPLDERVEAAEGAVRLWPIEPEYRMGLAILYQTAGNPLAAQGQMVAATTLSPLDVRVWSTWGDLYLQWGALEPARYAQAETAYRQALALAPNLATTHLALGTTLARQGRLEEAVAEVERALDLDATYVRAYQRLAELYQAQGRSAQAEWAQQQAEWWARKTGGAYEETTNAK